MSELVRVTRGVWRPPEQVADLAGRAAAALAACPVGSVLCGVTAGALHGLWLPHGLDARIEVIVRPELARPEQRPAGRRAEIRARRQLLRPDEVTLVDGLPVTSVATTWLHLAARLSLPDLAAAGDCALRCGVAMSDLAGQVARAVHTPGVVAARAALSLLNGRSRSRAESHLRYALVGGGLPMPDVNVAIYSDAGEWLAEPDLSYDDVRLAIEYNGADHAEPSRMRRDITRELDVERRGGWRVVVFGPAEVFGRPDQVASHVRWLRGRTGMVA